MNLLESLKTRYATKVFDSSKKISDTDLNEILEAFRLSASSFWLQPWKVIIVENPELREQLLPHSWNQKQVVEASHLLVLARIDKPNNELIEDYLNDIVATRWASREDLKGYEDMMKWFFASMDDQKRNFWATKQVNIALGNLLTFLAYKNIDSCPMEWFIPQKYDEILWLSELWLASELVLPIGYKSSEDKYAWLPKVRFGLDKLVIRK